MQILQGFESLNQEFSSSVVTIGNYDGVHKGHKELLKTLVQEAQFLGVPSVVVTFDPHPVKVLYPQRKTERLFDFQDQQEQLDLLGVQFSLVQKFTHEFAQLSAEVFFTDYLFAKLKPKTLVVGHDFSFGSQRTGNLEFLEKKCLDHGIKLIIIPPYKMANETVSSSRIRQALKVGDLQEVEKCLGRLYYLRGTVQKGFQRGRTIGVPTANILPDVEFIPRLGVYFTEVQIGQKKFTSITNIGVNPTVSAENDKSLKIETHIFDFDAQLYGVEICVHLFKFWRDERKFSNIEELKTQIQMDITQAKVFFEGGCK